VSTSSPSHVGGLEAIAEALAKAELIDLTVTLAERLPPAWPTHMPFQRKVYNWYASRNDQIQPIHGFRGPYHTAWLTLDEHCGTHFDAPAHFIPPPNSGLPHANEFGLITGDKVKLGGLIGPAAVIDVTELTDTGDPGVSPEILPAHVERWEDEHGGLRKGEIVLFRSDWDRHYVDMPDGASYITSSFLLQREPGWPTPDEPALEYLLGKGITTIGIDGASIGSAHNGPSAHWYGLGRGMLYIELLTNLSKLPPRGAIFMFLPLKIEGSSGGPGRAIAFVPRT
jgi:isatin hydrolase